MVVIGLNQVKCLSWCNCPNPERIGSLEISEVVRDYECATGGYRQFEYKIVAGIRQKGPPSVKNLLWMGEAAQDIQNNPDLFRGERWHKARAQSDGFVLNRQCHGKRYPDVSTANGPQNREARSEIGAKCR